MATLTHVKKESECHVMSCSMPLPQHVPLLPRPAHGIVVETYNFIYKADERDMLHYVTQSPLSVGVNAVSWQDYVGRGTGQAGQMVDDVYMVGGADGVYMVGGADGGWWAGQMVDGGQGRWCRYGGRGRWWMVGGADGRLCWLCRRNHPAPLLPPGTGPRSSCCWIQPHW